MVGRWIRALPLLAMSALLYGGMAFAGEVFGPGEQCTYQIHYLGVSAGTAQITVGAQTQQWGKQVLPIVTMAKADLSLYPVKDRFVTYWDTGEHRTIGSDLFADENHKRRRQRIMIDHHAGSATVTKQKEGEGPSESTLAVQAGSTDIAAAAFTMRNRSFAVGSEFEVPVFTGTRSFVLKAKIEARQTLQTTLGAREVFRVRVKTDFSGKLQSRRDMLVYFSTDEAHVLVRVEADFLFGSVVADLTDYKPGAQLAVNLR